MPDNYAATLLADYYKLSHRQCYAPLTTQVYSTWTPRGSRNKNIDKVVAFGFQAFIQRYLVEYFNEHFFRRSWNEVRDEYCRIVKHTLGIVAPETDHLYDLHDRGYLPLLIKALPEGTRVPLRVPMLTIENTSYDSFWLPNYIESLMSSELWHASTSATIANEFRHLFDDWAEVTGGDKSFVPFQGHDFSMRGMSCLQAAAASGAGHLLSFVGTDTIPAIMYAEKYYGANVEQELVGCSVSATEHSVASSYGPDDEKEYFRHLLMDVYPSGIVSVVSDTWDLWNVLTKILPSLHDEIMFRDGKLVIRPDSGYPPDIICGNPNAAPNSPEAKGVIELLWDEFGGSVNHKGYKVLDPHIGAIYGDAISYPVAAEICQRLAGKEFASTNMVFGIGSFSYQYVTRDNFSFALKSTAAVIGGVERTLFKDPITDPDSVKKSLRGRVVVIDAAHGPGLVAVDGLDKAGQAAFGDRDYLQTIFYNGEMFNIQSFSEIRKRLHQ